MPDMIVPALRAKGALPHGGGYSLNLPDRGMVGSGTTFEMLMTNLRKYRKANAIPVGLGFEDEVEREICARYSAECVETSTSVPNRTRTFSFDDVVNGTKAMIAFKLAGSPVVSQEEANRRAETCSKCPNNLAFSKPCGGICGALAELASAIVGAKTTPSDQALNSCAVCGCYIRASVWVDLPTQWQVLSEEMKNQFRTAKTQVGCWKVV